MGKVKTIKLRGKHWWVGDDGIDAPGYGITPDKPFKTIDYAYKIIEERLKRMKKNNFIIVLPEKKDMSTMIVYYESR